MPTDSAHYSPPPGAEGFLRSRYRTHTCGELRDNNAGNDVTLCGWVARKRDHGGVIFIDLRDHYGVTQVVFPGGSAQSTGSSECKATDLRPESVIQVCGKVAARAPHLVNDKLATGAIEIQVASWELITMAQVLPFQVAEDDGAPEPIRLKHRFLELRRDRLHANIVLRNRVIQAMRTIMHDLGFLEFHTPILTSSSPEGARDFIVPSRLHPGKFYALPQAPQQFKQLLMIAGFDRYFQIAPCFRDEDARADRSPGEFYQIDMELSFVEEQDVLRINEELFARLIPLFSDWSAPTPPFPRFRYREALERFGTDKPDLRCRLELQNVSEIFKQTQFKVFREALDRNQSIRAIACNVESVPSRKYFDETVEFFQQQSGSGVAYVTFDGEAVKGTLAKFLSADEVAQLRSAIRAEQRAVVFVAAGDSPQVLAALARLRVRLSQDLKHFDANVWRFCWITDFPFYERNTETGGIDFCHNPFSMPQGGMQSLCTVPPLEILAHQYDFVCHGFELASGGIRNHDPEIMYKAFEIAGYTREMVDEKFGGMIRAFRYGAPPHGGIAHGIERIVMLLAGEEAIRDVIAFPLAQNGEDLLMGAPSSVSERQLRDVHIQVRPNAVARPT